MFQPEGIQKEIRRAEGDAFSPLYPPVLALSESDPLTSPILIKGFRTLLNPTCQQHSMIPFCPPNFILFFSYRASLALSGNGENNISHEKANISH